MIDFETFARIKNYHDQRGLNAAQIAESLGIDQRTVAKWLRQKQFLPRSAVQRSSKLDPFKSVIKRMLEAHPYSAKQILQKLQEDGYSGGYSILKEYVAKVRPSRSPAFLTLSFAPGECAQVDWGEYGSINIGSTRRRLSFFLMVLCHSRMAYLEFTVSQTMEHFLAAHQHGFEFFGGVPEKIMLDNLKSAVLKRSVGSDIVLNPRYLDFANHYGFAIIPCAVGKGNEKGRVENGIGYVKKNFLNGLDCKDFSAIHPAARLWLDTIANIRIHGETKKRPVDLFQEEKPRLSPLPPLPYDLGTVHSVRASNRFRVSFDANRYSVPAELTGARLTLKAYPDRVCILNQEKLVARHTRSYDRNQDFEDPDHPRALLEQRHNAKKQRIIAAFLAISPKAQLYYQGLEQRRLNLFHHIQKIVALSEIHGRDAVARVIEDALACQAFSCEYLANLLEQRSRIGLIQSPGAILLTRRQDLLDLDMAEPNLTIYELMS